MATTDESAVRDYLIALKDPTALRDDQRIDELQKRLAATDDQLERVLLRQQIDDARRPSLERYEETFVTHAKAWADEQGIGAAAFAAEGVPERVLRRAGFRVSGRQQSRRRRSAPTRPRVGADAVRAAFPRGAFTIRDLQERTGGSAATIRNVVRQAEEDGLIQAQGTATDHRGPGRAPTLYKRIPRK